MSSVRFPRAVMAGAEGVAEGVVVMPGAACSVRADVGGRVKRRAVAGSSSGSVVEGRFRIERDSPSDGPSLIERADGVVSNSRG